jgi:hypothetical protein
VNIGTGCTLKKLKRADIAQPRSVARNGKIFPTLSANLLTWRARDAFEAKWLSRETSEGSFAIQILAE